jgi:RNA polymerase sigma-70 factor (ECF subfamily)
MTLRERLLQVISSVRTTGQVTETRRTMGTDLVTHPHVETRLIARAKDGDEQAFEALYHAFERRVYLLCVRMTGDSSEAEDLTQESFLQIFRKISTFRNESAFATWLHRVTVNVVLMHHRRKRLRLVPFEHADVSQEEPAWREYGAEDRTLVGLIDRILIRRAITQLPEGRRAVLVLHDLEGYRHTEIAKLQDCSIGNSKSQLSRARWNMRELLQPRRNDLSASAIAKKVKTRGHRAGHQAIRKEGVCGLM